MSAKSGPIVLLAAGAAALMMMGGKKKPKKKPIDKLIIDAECSKILNRLEFDPADKWLTTRAQELVAEYRPQPDEDPGSIPLHKISVKLLQEQAPHCPWDDSTKWTKFMKDIHRQLTDAVVEWYAQSIEHEGELYDDMPTHS